MLANDDLGNLGRLGNQMFQYASLRGIAAKRNYEYCLPPREIVGTRDLKAGNSDITIFECFKLPDVQKCITNFPKIHEASFVIDNNILYRCPDNVSIHGYFQSETYFKHIEDQIRESFIFVDEIYEPTKEMFDSNFYNTEVISVHLRRGDYLKYPNHPVQELKYYAKGLSKLPSDIPVMVFSDDIEWCEEQDIFQGDRFFLAKGNNTAVDLCLQSLCTYHIIGNSSFSWWGSWLAKSKKTIAPSIWFGGPDAHKDLSYLYISDWIII